MFETDFYANAAKARSPWVPEITFKSSDVVFTPPTAAVKKPDAVFETAKQMRESKETVQAY